MSTNAAEHEPQGFETVISGSDASEFVESVASHALANPNYASLQGIDRNTVGGAIQFIAERLKVLTEKNKDEDISTVVKSHRDTTNALLGLAQPLWSSSTADVFIKTGKRNTMMVRPDGTLDLCVIKPGCVAKLSVPGLMPDEVEDLKQKCEKCEVTPWQTIGTEGWKDGANENTEGGIYSFDRQIPLKSGRILNWKGEHTTIQPGKSFKVKDTLEIHPGE